MRGELGRQEQHGDGRNSYKVAQKTYSEEDGRDLHGDGQGLTTHAHLHLQSRGSLEEFIAFDLQKSVWLSLMKIRSLHVPWVWM